MLATSVGYGPLLLFLIPCWLVVFIIGITSLIFQLIAHNESDRLLRIQPWTIVFTSLIGIGIHIDGWLVILRFSDVELLHNPDWIDNTAKVIWNQDKQFIMIVAVGVFFWVASFLIRIFNNSKQKQRRY